MRTAVISHFAAGELPQQLYRAFGEEEYARRLVEEGRLRISTLGICRRHEDLRRDRDEGVQRHFSGTVSGGPSDPNVHAVLERLGLAPGAGERWLLDHNVAITRLADAWVLCLFERLDSAAPRKFGRFVVAVSDPTEAFRLITWELERRFGLEAVGFNRVVYATRDTTGDAPAAGPIGFVKSPDRYSAEQEVRMLWIPRTLSDATVLPYVETCIPELSRLCSLIELEPAADDGALDTLNGPWRLSTPELVLAAGALEAELREWISESRDPEALDHADTVLRGLPPGALRDQYAAGLDYARRRRHAARVEAFEARFQVRTSDIADAMLVRLPYPLPFSRDPVLSDYRVLAYTGQFAEIADDLSRLAAQLPN